MIMKEKSRKLIWIAVTASALIVIAAVICFAVRHTSHTISGDWELIVNPELADSASDEADSSQKVYYTFSKPGQYGDGEYKTIFDGGIETGAYKLSEKDGRRCINMGTADLEYTIEGAELTITYPERADAPAADYIFKRAKAPEYETESYAVFETDENLIAEWLTEERTLSYYAYELSYTETVEFLETGVMVISYYSEDLLLDRAMYYAYTAENGTLLFSSVTDKETQYRVSYTFDSDGNLKFENDDTAASIFADAFFSDVTYYQMKG